jgi:hypothetical protein
MSRLQAGINQLIAQPKRIFLIDGLGALLSAILLIAVMARFEDFIGIPQGILYLLSGIASFFALYSLACSFLVLERWRVFLKIILLANAVYCLLTIGVLLYFSQSLTILGLAYFLAELSVVGILIWIERRAVYS